MARLTREQSQELTRDRLLSSAADVIARFSYDGASVDRIAEEAGFSKGAFYSNFASKEDILEHVLEAKAPRDVEDLTKLLDGVDEPDRVIDLVAQWSDARAAEKKWGLIAIEFLRRAQRDGTLSEHQRHLFTKQWEEIGALLLRKLLPGVDSGIPPVDLGGLVQDLTYGGIAVYLGENSSGQMLRHVLVAIHAAAQVPAPSS